MRIYAGMLYTCRGKGGEYRVLDLSTGAGTSKGLHIVVYVCSESGRMFHRTLEDFKARMVSL